MATTSGARLVAVESDEVLEAALEKGLIREGDIVFTAGDESYEDLTNLPSINGVPIIGDKKPEDFGVESAEALSYEDIMDIINKFD